MLMAALGLMGIFVLIALIDAAHSVGILAGFSVQLPAVVRMSKDRAGKIEVRIRNEKQGARTLRLGLPFPEQIDSEQTDAIVSLPAETEWSRYEWPCLPRKRGNYPIETVYLETPSPFGFWARRGVARVQSELRVYPNLFSERKQLAALFLNRGTFGLHAQRQIGKGRDFEKLREYIPGDSFDEIHWKASAKRGRPVTKVFQIERTQEVYVIIDASRLSARPLARAQSAASKVLSSSPEGQSHSETTVEPETILERLMTAALVLGLAAEQQGDLFGLLTFADQVKTFVRAKNGKAHFSSCRDALYTLQPHIVTPDYDEVCTFIRLRLRHRALLVFLTSLDDPLLAESFVRNMDLIRRQHLILVNMLQPPGVSPMFTNPNIASMDDLYQHLGGHLLWQKLRELEKILQRRGVQFSLLQNERLSADLVTQYLNVKRRQLI
jgi:Uncharacterized conserved protein (some members contain a von Willebrand factor type A (vWA) domain)